MFSEFADPMGHRWSDKREAIAIFREGEIDKVQEALGATGPRRNRLAGLVRCRSCGSQLVVRTAPGSRRYYSCGNAASGVSGAACCSEKFSIRADFVEYVVKKVLSGQELDDEAGGGSPGVSS